MANAIITGTGSYIPALRIPNKYFLSHEFYKADGQKIDKSNEDIIKKLGEITGINERRYVTTELNTSDIAFLAADQAIAGIDRESLD
jgi:3-oxoacyl-[acyl-carrier-protein] synthase-3